MVRILWFKETSRWSRRGIPLRVVWVSPRQLAILLSSFLVGLFLSIPLPMQTLKLVAVGFMLLVGAVVSFWRVKMLTPERLIIARLRGSTRLSPKGANAKAKSPTPETPSREPDTFQIEADNPESFTPLSINGRWRRTKYPVKVSLYVDGLARPGAEALAIPGDKDSSYTIVFQPTVADIGTHELEVRVEGEAKPIYTMKVDVKVKGARSLEMKKVS
ncbi:MAG: hypothetical protein LYZ66_01865 [Nitrososphaerales archaeon]|nr:hypothetical protein [Nitrososphaerales archaeon]